MLPATLVTLVTFLLDLTNSSPVYNMQPAFITTNIGSTNGRNIRNLPCVSRKNSGLSGVCMFAIDCLKSNGTHLGTCIDRFYFGSCCHIEPIKEIGNSIETNIILDSREPPQRLQNKTSILSTSTTQSSLGTISSSHSTTPTLNKLNQQNKATSSSATTQHSTTSTVSPNPTKLSSTLSSSSSLKPSSITRPYGEKIPLGSTTSTTSTTEVTTVAQKLQTFQIVDGSLLAATTLKPVEATTKRASPPVKTSTKPPSTTTKPRPGITSPSKPYQKPSASSTSSKPTTKPTTKPTKPSKPVSSRKPTQKPSKPVKVSSATKRPTTTTAKTTSTRRTAGTKPTRRVTKPSGNTTSAKPSSTTSKRPQTTSERTTRKPPIILTKKPSVPSSTTASSVATKRPSGTSPSPSAAATISTSSLLELVSLTSQSSSATSTSTSSSVTTANPVLLSTTASENLVIKKNISQILESATINTATNEVIESSGYLTVGNGSASTLRPVSSSTTTDGISTTSKFNSSNETSSASISTSTTLPTKPSTLSTSTASNAINITSTTKPVPGIITWTLEDTKNHTAVNMENETVVMGNITEEWVPITTPDGWVLLPSVTAVTGSSSSTKNETSTSSISTESTSPSVESLSTFIPIVTLAPEIPSTPSLLEVSITTLSPDSSNFTLSSTSAQESTSSSTSLVTSIVTSTSEGEKGMTSPPSVTDVLGNATTTTGGDENLANMETSSVATSTELVMETKPVNMTDFTDVCGRRMWPEARIVGGEKSTFGKWPWQISLRQWRTSTYLHKCGAALLNENWAITAAHCVDNVPPSDLLLRLGEHDLSTETEPYLHEERRVQIVASHPQFDPRTFEYDLALLRFYEPVQFQPNILPVCVPTKEESFVGRTAYVTGWGRLYEDGPLPSILQEVSVPVINNSVCESMYRSAGYIEHIPHIFICAGWRRGGFDSCEGDSGGPMVIQREDKRFLLAGVISWGIGCAEPNQPGVYTRISEFRDWINQILQF